MIATRFAAQPTRLVLGREVPVATSVRARLLGLAHLDRDLAGAGLLIPRCAAIHTFGMRFPLDLVFLDERGVPLSTRHRVPRRRFACHRGAVAVLEIPAAAGGEFPSPGT